ncbi:MAG TPA: hypothetical protein PLG50_01650 [bacterium]|nr:hypothetical protein [bacterium]HQG44348.1 hypothetical protein [bacterium]HQI49083.1 hypothetical protein [bacterium]HQJ63284.1 hypothetical protein [bacterium]
MNQLLPGDSNAVYLVLFLVSLVAAFILLTIFGGKGGSKTPARKKRSGSLSGLTMLLLTLSALLLGYFIIYLYYFSPLQGERPVAHVEFQKSGAASSGFKVIVIPYESGKPGPAKNCSVKGDWWALQGEVLQWKAFLGKVGLRTMFRLTAVEGYSRQDGAMRKVSSVALASNTGQILWKAAQRLNGLLGWARVVSYRSERAEPVWSGGYDLVADDTGLRIASRRPAQLPAKSEGIPERERRYPRRPEEVRH